MALRKYTGLPCCQPASEAETESSYWDGPFQRNSGALPSPGRQPAPLCLLKPALAPGTEAGPAVSTATAVGQGSWAPAT